MHQRTSPSTRYQAHPESQSPCSHTTDAALAGNGSGERGEHPEPAGEVRPGDLVHLVAGPQTEAGPERGPRDVHVGDPVHRAVVEREHAVALGLREPQRHQLPQLLGLLRGEVHLLRGIDAGVEQRPFVGREVVAADEQVAFGRGQLVDVVRHGLPSVGVDRPAPPALEVLARPRTCGLRRRRPPHAGSRRRTTSARCRRARREAGPRTDRAPSAARRSRGSTGRAARRGRRRRDPRGSSGCALHPRTCSASTAGTACSPRAPIPTGSDRSSGSHRGRRGGRGCPRRRRPRRRCSGRAG